jgi:ribokinase
VDRPGVGGAVCVVGSANLDLVAATARLPAPGETVLGTDFAQHAGGKGLNQAVAAARAGAATAFVGAVGDDDAARILLAELAAAGIDTSLVGVRQRPTGRAVITVDERGENSIVVVPGANEEVVVDALPSAAVLLVQLEVPVAAVADALRLARSAGAITVLNPAPATRLEGDLLRLVDVLVPNEHELALLGSADRLLADGVGAVVTTLGGAGVRVVSPDGAWHVAPFHVLPVDTTGAGDAFCGTLAARLAAGDALDAAVRVAAAAGALATTRRGAVPSMPHAADVAALLAAQ